LGIALGIGIHTYYHPDSRQSLIAQGILDALAAGILTYDGLVNIVQPHLKSKGFRRSSKFQRWIQFLSLWLGATSMAILGRWM
jgi:zinc transporter 1/2/3